MLARLFTSPTSVLAQLRLRVAASHETSISIVLVILFAFFAIRAPNFLAMYALSNVLTFASVYGIIVCGVGLLMIAGEFDLSVGSVLALSGYVFLLSLRADVPPLLAMLLALAVCSLAGFVNGLLVVSTRIPSFIVTLGTGLAFRGIVRALGQGRATSYAPQVKPILFEILNGYLTPINQLSDTAGNFRTSSIWFICVVALTAFLLMRTRFGNWVFAVGGNQDAARSQGINIRRVKLTAFVLSGFLAGLAGVITFAQRSSMNTLLGEGLELTMVAASVIGGVRLTGGSGTMVGAALGMLLLSLLNQGVVLMGVPNDVFQGLVGAVLIVVVLGNYRLRQEE